MEYNKTGNDETQLQQQKVELKKVLEASLRREEGGPVVLGDVSKWEKIDPMTLLVAKKLNLGLNESYLPLLRDNPETGLYTLIIGKYYKKKAEEEGLKHVAEEIESLLQKAGTTIDQLTIYSATRFKKIPDNKKVLKAIEAAKKEIKKAEKSLEIVVSDEVKTSEVLVETIKTVALKASYPILGNLPFSLQEKLEEKVGQERYNAIEATDFSLISNLIGGGVAGGFVGDSYNHWILGAIGGVGIMITDVWLRSKLSGVNMNNNVPIKSGSFILELATMPFEWIYSSYKESKERVKQKKRRGGL
ncbi:hypothetical protein HY643_02510 [Candidatus Woesearchaeota archaeon]|nr:hypothetical protein [Candidatus Woesearchaeota archaeon]